MANLAVIGAGVGGCSAAYFARKYIPDLKVTIFEKTNRIGGRVFTFNQEKMNNELGAAFFNPMNKTVCNLVNELGLEIKKSEESMDIGIWNGNEITFRSNQSNFYMMLKLFSKYKLSIVKLLLCLKETNKKIKKMYLQEEKPTELWQLFESIGLDKWYKRSFDQILLELGIDEKFIDELITPITRIIYSQNAELGGFAGISSLLGVYGEEMYSLKEGNEVLPKKILIASAAKVKLNNKVTSIEKTSKNRFRVLVGKSTYFFDNVIVATPHEGAKITFEGDSKRKLDTCEYQKIYIRLLKGVVNSKFFNLKDTTKIPSIILTSKGADPITRFSIKPSTKNDSFVAITSTEPIGNDFLVDLFKTGQIILDHTWSGAYPIFNPIQKIPPICLDNGLFYLNAIESAASSLESSTFAASKIIKILKKQLSSKLV